MHSFQYKGRKISNTKCTWCKLTIPALCNKKVLRLFAFKRNETHVWKLDYAKWQNMLGCGIAPHKHKNSVQVVNISHMLELDFKCFGATKCSSFTQDLHKLPITKSWKIHHKFYDNSWGWVWCNNLHCNITDFVSTIALPLNSYKVQKFYVFHFMIIESTPQWLKCAIHVTFLVFYVKLMIKLEPGDAEVGLQKFHRSAFKVDLTSNNTSTFIKFYSSVLWVLHHAIAENVWLYVSCHTPPLELNRIQSYFFYSSV